LGFASLPLAVLAILVGSQSIGLIFALQRDAWAGRSLTGNEIAYYTKWAAMGFAFWLWWVLCPFECIVVVLMISPSCSALPSSFLGVKVIIGVNLVGYATSRRAGMEARRTEDDVINNFNRDPIGEGKEEQVRFVCAFLAS
jgi:hypothetical protein